ncbi:hypothetical protein JMA_27150 [Jeotgalibacillus malaysiensis]|uniref:Phage head-tail adapter protein n=1 Tax=Jeotgalibacillus malaysiensis TaxID=1508404 RepID=A0A0B5ATI2_9BACL|nr:hypothetical protein [Jeotgalibacillus malaysiensis]AJD92032.1 hypothetical protein JMA_27150 [Jeotgalibacillus malaysiensis]
MRFNDVVNLLTVEVTYDDLGNPVDAKTERQVFANRMSVSTTEFYGDASNSLRPEKRFEVRTADYQDETELKHEGITYRISRTEYRGDFTRLTCERSVGDD